MKIIFEYYRLVLDSQVSTQKEQELFLKLLIDTLQQQEINKSMKSMEQKLLFRASEHEFDRNAFHKF